MTKLFESGPTKSILYGSNTVSLQNERVVEMLEDLINQLNRKITTQVTSNVMEDLFRDIGPLLSLQSFFCDDRNCLHWSRLAVRSGKAASEGHFGVLDSCAGQDPGYFFLDVRTFLRRILRVIDYSKGLLVCW